MELVRKENRIRYGKGIGSPLLLGKSQEGLVPHAIINRVDRLANGNVIPVIPYKEGSAKCILQSRPELVREIELDRLSDVEIEHV